MVLAVGLISRVDEAGELHTVENEIADVVRDVRDELVPAVGAVDDRAARGELVGPDGLALVSRRPARSSPGRVERVGIRASPGFRRPA